ncbi:MAG TPA: flagellar assembly protein FliW [Bryobacteraceae bacterium]|nr:flagellar assembly protein FliW [Bryobacteraceae bacterium]
MFDFPQGLPAFEEEKRFVLIELPDRAPLVFLQSLSHASLGFAAFPISAVDEKYQLAIAAEDLEGLGLDSARQPVIGDEVIALALVSLHGKFQATANLMAPIVLNLKRRRGLQAIRRDARYSHVHPLGEQGKTAEPQC